MQVHVGERWSGREGERTSKDSNSSAGGLGGMYWSDDAGGRWRSYVYKTSAASAQQCTPCWNSLYARARRTRDGESVFGVLAIRHYASITTSVSFSLVDLRSMATQHPSSHVLDTSIGPQRLRATQPLRQGARFGTKRKRLTRSGPSHTCLASRPLLRIP
jgi:hypothetical protein